MTTIFREEILDHYKHPRNFGELPDATVRQEGDNVPCGDHVMIAVKLNDGTLEEIKFQGEGCALSIAATSMLTEKVHGVPFTGIERIADSDIIAMAVPGLISPGRVSCVVLGLKTLQKALASLQARHSNAPLVTKDMNLGEIAARWPQARTVLLDYGLHCVGCFASSFDTIEAGGKVHGMSDEEIEQMVIEVNSALQRTA